METSAERQIRFKARYYTTATAAARLDCSEETVKKWCQDEKKRQRLGAWKPAGQWKIPFEHLERLIERAEATGGGLF